MTSPTAVCGLCGSPGEWGQECASCAEKFVSTILDAAGREQVAVRREGDHVYLRTTYTPDVEGHRPIVVLLKLTSMQAWGLGVNLRTLGLDIDRARNSIHFRDPETQHVLCLNMLPDGVTTTSQEDLATCPPVLADHRVA